MSNYVIGGWTQSTSNQPPDESFAYTMYGMITNLNGLTSGTPSQPGWSPKDTNPPSIPGKVLWTYGGAGCTPNGMPDSDQNVNDIISATNSSGWDGVDFDDECQMNTDLIIDTMESLKPKESSYTFLAGWNYNNPDQSDEGKQINQNVQKIGATGLCDRFILMCYGDAMWSMPDIQNNVGPAIERTIAHLGNNSNKKVILALTPAGLNQENLNYFLNQVLKYDLGGLFIWEFPNLSHSDLETIKNTLGIS
ncbi:MAG: hypothetical protein F6J90_21135 [Moorea sp. SIOASIH]|uniref:hypothetical protein n=1 Tax=Moorena sp. SIOASIH TaxID=2607817 RepID=UPI0013BD9E0F|nr:hypothetical protein [Moorena sp. SIOASIH]NEO38698.1 hypothetical protein [Moorena sp. SIOASIH]